MSDASPDVRDDAPVTTSKRDEAVDDATAALVEDKGDTLVGKSVTIRRPRAEPDAKVETAV